MCLSCYLLADRLFYKLCQAGVLPQFGVTLPLSVTISLSLGSSWSTQCSCNLAANSVQQCFQAYLQLDFRLYLVSHKNCLFYPGCDLYTTCQCSRSI